MLNKELELSKKLPIKEFLIDEEEGGVEAISLVEFPAIEIDYMKFSKMEPIKFSITNEDEQIFTGPLMIPDKLIYRVDADGTEYYGYFSADTIKKVAQKYMLEGRQSNVTLEHEMPIDGVCLIESWLVKDSKKDKATALGYDVPPMTWMGSMKVTNKELWDELKNSDFNGFSIEGHFLREDKKQTAEMSSDEELFEQVIDILMAISDADRTAPNFLNAKTLPNVDKSHLEVMYQWYPEPEACPACVEHGEKGPKPLSYWLKTAIPKVPRGVQVGNFSVTDYDGTQVDGQPFQFGTFCEEACRCHLIKHITQIN